MRRLKLVMSIVAIGLAAAMVGGVVLAQKDDAPKKPVSAGNSRSVQSVALGDTKTDRPMSPKARSASGSDVASKGAVSSKWSHVPPKKSAPAGNSNAALGKLPAQIVSTPAVADGIAYVGTRDGVLSAVDLATGDLKWSYNAAGAIDSSPEIVNGKIYATSKDGYLHVVNLGNGSRVRTVHTGGADSSSVASDGSLLFFGSGFPNRDVFAVGAGDGGIQWRYKTGQMVYSSPVVSQGTVYVGSNDGSFYALDAKAGTVKWRFATKGNIFKSSPAVDGNVVYLAPGGLDPNIYAVDAASGRELARYSVGGDFVSSPIVAGGTVYIQSGNAADERNKGTIKAHPTWLFALKYSGSGFRKLWQAPTGFALSEGFASSPAVGGGLVYVGSGDGYLYAFDASSSALHDRVQVGTAGVVSSPVVVGQTVVVADLAGTLRAFADPSLPKAN